MNDRRWSEARAHEWYDRQPWLVGCNFTPSTAINQLEMWQADTFDLPTIERELGWAAGIGFNLVRVFLHDLVWKQDAEGFKSRLDQVLAAGWAHGIRMMPVFFDDCWHTDPQLGEQPAPIPGVHNSGWKQSPGDRVARDPNQWGYLEAYVKDVIGAFGSDERVAIWDLYNEPGNCFLPTMSRSWPVKLVRLPPLLVHHLLFPSPTLPLLRQTFQWARQIDPHQPLTAGLWFKNRGLNRFQLESSDIVSFHHYEPLAKTERYVAALKEHGRPLICTEYLARTMDNHFRTHLPFFARERIGCTNWGLVIGKTQTAFSWQDRPGGAEPAVWFHDVLRADGSPYDPEEVELIRRLTAEHRG